MRGARLGAGMSQQRVADEVGQPFVTMIRYESGQSEPSVSHPLAIARALTTWRKRSEATDNDTTNGKEER